MACIARASSWDTLRVLSGHDACTRHEHVSALRYRKTFQPDASWGERLELFIEGCYMNCSVYLNGKHLYTHPYGYTSFSVDLSAGGLLPSKTNVLAIRVESRGSNSRWHATHSLDPRRDLLA